MGVPVTIADLLCGEETNASTITGIVIALFGSRISGDAAD